MRLRKSTIASLNGYLGDAACAWRDITGQTTLSGYLYRQGIGHLLSVHENQLAYDMLVEYGYHSARLASENGAGVTGVIRDIRAASPEEDKNPLSSWHRFYQIQQHLLERGDNEWSAHKILLQVAVEHGDNSQITQLAEAWLQRGHCDWTWIRRVRRPKDIAKDPCIRVLSGHKEDLVMAISISASRLITASADTTIRLWDIETGECLQVFAGHQKSVVGLIKLDEQRFLSWSLDGTARGWMIGEDQAISLLEHVSPPGEDDNDRFGRGKQCIGMSALDNARFLVWWGNGASCLWDGVSNEPLAVLEPHKQAIKGGYQLDEERILSWSLDGQLHESNAETGEFYGEMGPVRHVETLPGNRALVCGAKGMGIYAHYDWSFVKTLKAHPKGVLGLHITAEHIVSWSADGSICRWSLEGDFINETGGPDFPIFSGAKSGALYLTDNRVATWSPSRGRQLMARMQSGKDFSIRVWDLENPEGNRRLIGHTDRVWGMLELSGNRLLSWSWDTTLRVWDLGTGEQMAVLRGHQGEVNGAYLLSDGRFVSWAEDGNLCLWRGKPETGSNLEIHDHLIASAALCGPDIAISSGAWRGRHNRSLEAWDDDEIPPSHRVWNTQTGELINKQPTYHDELPIPDGVPKPSPSTQHGLFQLNHTGARIYLSVNDQPLAVWHGVGLDADMIGRTPVDRARSWWARDMDASGTMLASCNRELAILHLYRGAERIPLEGASLKD